MTEGGNYLELIRLQRLGFSAMLFARYGYRELEACNRRVRAIDHSKDTNSDIMYSPSFRFSNVGPNKRAP